MEELKLLIGMVRELPGLALWVLVAFYAYKVMIVGSIYGLIRFIVEKTHSWLVTRKTADVNIRGTIDGMVITHDNSHRALFAQLERLRGKRCGGGGLGYIHGCSVEWLRDAIDAQEAKDLEAAKGKA